MSRGVTGTWREKNVSSMSSTGGGKTARSRPNRPRACSAARLVVAVEATIFGPGAVPSSIRPAAELVDGGLEQADGGAERAGDQVQFVLDDRGPAGGAG